METSPSFIEGLSRVLIGIRAHISSYVISAPLAYHIVTKGSRFEFSHEFSYFLLAQLEDFIEGKPISVKIRSRKHNKDDIYEHPNLHHFLNSLML